MAGVSLLSYTDEMRPQGDTYSLFEIFFKLGGATFFALMLLVFLIWALAKLWRKKWSEFALLSSCILVSVILPTISFKIAQPIAKVAETRYIDRLGRAELRNEVADLIAKSDSIEGSLSYFGKSIEVEDVPPLLLEFTRGQGIELNKHGVVYRTRGLGSWRGGYMITPAGSDKDPDTCWNEKIIDGFYRVVSN